MIAFIYMIIFATTYIILLFDSLNCLIKFLTPGLDSRELNM